MLDPRDIAILDLLQQDADTPLAAISAHVHLSPSACSRRIAHLREAGYIRRNVVQVDRRRIGLPTTLFVSIRAKQHCEEWTTRFRAAIEAIPEIVEAHRMTGTVDYLLKVVLPSVERYDAVYKQLIAAIEMSEVSAHISMETLKDASALPLGQLAPRG